ncbi:MAG: N-acetylmuramic acid 6-phosphate etherase [Bacteroidota bacterium]
MKKTTEAASPYRHLEQMSVLDILTNINREDQTVAQAVNRAIPQIERLVITAVERLQQGGRLFYLGAGTSGRLGILDASECPPTYGVPENMVIGLIAGGDKAIRKAVEDAEDSPTQAWVDLNTYLIDRQDMVVGLTASGSTPYVVNGLAMAQKNGFATGCITCNTDTLIRQYADYPIEVIVGPEFVTGSTRMKAGTAQKMVLNMISTSVMIRLGRVLDNKMVDMQLNNAKLVQRGALMLVQALAISEGEARNLLASFGSVRRVLDYYRNGASQS